MAKAATGFRVHSGWVAAVTVSADRIVDRRVLLLADPKIPGSKQPFHAAEGLAHKEAEALIAKCRESTIGERPACWHGSAAMIGRPT